MWEKWSWIKRESLSTFWRKKKKNPQIQFVLQSIPNHVSRLRWHPCSAAGRNMLMPHMPGVCCVLFKVCQEVHRGECVSSLLNPEPLVSHHITNLPPPAVCADPATKHFLPGCCTEHLRRLFAPTAIRLQTGTPLPARLAPASASSEGAEAGCGCTSRVSRTRRARGLLYTALPTRGVCFWRVCVFVCDC